MASAIVQMASYVQPSTTTDHTMVFPSAPTEGNLIVVLLTERQPAPQVTPSMTTAGYTLVDVGRWSDTDSTHRRGSAVYYKVAGASESATVVGSWPFPDKGNGVSYALELSGVGAYRSNFGYTDNGDVQDETVLASNNLTTAANATIVAFNFYKSQAQTPTADFDVAFSNGFTAGDPEPGLRTGTSYNLSLIGAVADKSAAGSYNTTTTMTATDTSNRNITTMLVEFATAGDDPGPPGAPGMPTMIGASF